MKNQSKTSKYANYILFFSFDEFDHNCHKLTQEVTVRNVEEI